jgi:hypothetical protein
LRVVEPLAKPQLITPLFFASIGLDSDTPHQGGGGAGGLGGRGGGGFGLVGMWFSGFERS